MSLKAIHVVFIAASIVVTFLFAGWEFWAYYHQQALLDLVLGVTSLTLGILLVIYGRYFLKKYKTLSYL
jgi:hypothetical protein